MEHPQNQSLNFLQNKYLLPFLLPHIFENSQILFSQKPQRFWLQVFFSVLSRAPQLVLYFHLLHLKNVFYAQKNLLPNTLSHLVSQIKNPPFYTEIFIKSSLASLAYSFLKIYYHDYRQEILYSNA